MENARTDVVSQRRPVSRHIWTGVRAQIRVLRRLGAATVPARARPLTGRARSPGLSMTWVMYPQLDIHPLRRGRVEVKGRVPPRARVASCAVLTQQQLEHFRG